MHRSRHITAQDLGLRRLCFPTILTASPPPPPSSSQHPLVLLGEPLLRGQRASSSCVLAELRMVETGGRPSPAVNRCNQAISLPFYFFLINSHDKWVYEGGQPAPGVLYFNQDNRRSWIHKTIMCHLSILPSNWTLRNRAAWAFPSIREAAYPHSGAGGIVALPSLGARSGSGCSADQRAFGGAV